MTHTAVGGEGQTRGPAEGEVLAGWYRHAGQQPGSVGVLLRLLREREGITPAEQRVAFGADEETFAHLESMRQPRTDRYAVDARSIAEACGVGRPFAVVQALLLARNLAAEREGATDGRAYEAAFDASEGFDLDSLDSSFHGEV